MASQSQNPHLHFILLPVMAQGHLIPMTDLAKLLAERGMIVTIITTPRNASRFKTIIDRAIQSGYPIHLLQLPFPWKEAGLPEGCENYDSLPSKESVKNFFIATDLLQKSVEEHLQKLQPLPSCIIHDKVFHWTLNTARKLQIPRFVFHGTSLFYLFCYHNILKFKLHENEISDSEPFMVPKMPDQMEITKAQLPESLKNIADLKDFRSKVRDAEQTADGAIINSFYELESEYVKEYQKEMGYKVWCIGPVSLSNREILDKVERGNKTSINVKQCLKWLDSREINSVIYACLGSQCRLKPSQLIEIGLGLESSKRSFIWVIRDESLEFEDWLLREKFEERIIERGFLIRGWAPQILILSHEAIGGFLTHCGWNSTMEGLCAGVPMITWPICADQFINEKFIIEVLKIGIMVGVEIAVNFGEKEKIEVLVKREKVKKAVEELMDEREEGEERRNRARKIRDMAKRAMEVGGSSHSNMTQVIQDIMYQLSVKQCNL